MRKVMMIIMGLFLILSACNKEKDEAFSYGKVKNNEFEHLHGVGYINGDNSVVIATHNGLYAFDETGWTEATREKHDYMGFQAVRDGFFGSGHPEPGSDYKNPFGLLKSTDRGASIEKLAFYGEIDFHYLAAGYDSNAIYVLNEIQPSDLSKGLNYSLDEGKSWTAVSMTNFNSEFISNLAAHPSKKEMLAIGSKDGLFLSEDYGESFELFNNQKIILYTTLIEDGGLYSSFENNEVKLTSFEFVSRKEKELPLPQIDPANPIVMIAVNPTNNKEIVIATYKNDLFITKDAGVKWDTIVTRGKLSS